MKSYFVFFQLIYFGCGAFTYAQTQDVNPNTPPPVEAGEVNQGKKEEKGLFEESSPYLEYGDFNSNQDEDDDTAFFQYGRFFGLRFGLGYQTATGNRGLLYQSALPRLDLGVQYWFDFQFAMSLGIFYANHSFDYAGKSYSVKLIGYGVDFKYYFDVRDAAAAITFANPFVLAGLGSMSKTQTSSDDTVGESDSSFTVALGGGFEFPISYKKTYFVLEAKYNTQNFADTNETDYEQRVPDLSGGFFSLMGHFLLTW